MARRIIGRKCKLYVNTGVSFEVPSWTELALVGDVTVNDSKTTDDASSRESGFELVLGTMRKLSIDADMIYKPTDPAVAAIIAAYEADDDEEDSILDVLELDGPVETAGSSGVRAPMTVTKIGQNQKLKGLVRCPVTLEPTLADWVPVKYVSVGS